MIVGTAWGHLAFYEFYMLIEAAGEVIDRLRAQACHHPTTPAALVRPIQA